MRNRDIARHLHSACLRLVSLQVTNSSSIVTKLSRRKVLSLKWALLRPASRSWLLMKKTARRLLIMLCLPHRPRDWSLAHQRTLTLTKAHQLVWPSSKSVFQSWAQCMRAKTSEVSLSTLTCNISSRQGRVAFAAWINSVTLRCTRTQPCPAVRYLRTRATGSLISLTREAERQWAWQAASLLTRALTCGTQCYQRTVAVKSSQSSCHVT